MSTTLDKVQTGYFPRPHQELLHSRLKRFNVLVCHRRFGKTVFSIAETLDQSLRNPKKSPQYFYIAPTFGQAKRVAWDILKDLTKNFPGVTTHEQELRVDIPRPHSRDRIRIQLLSAENPDAIRGVYADGVILDEYADCDPSIWTKVVRPALSDRRGWAIFIGTPKGQNHFWDILADAVRNADHGWFHAIFKASETKILPEDELTDARRTMAEEEYAQEYECSFAAALTHAYYGKHMAQALEEKRITKVPYDKASAVTIYFDLGISDHMAMWAAQSIGREVRAINYYEASGQGLDDFCDKIREWRDKYGYSYERIVLPHDGKARSLETGKSRQQHMMENLRLPVDVLPRMSLADGINAVRLLLPRVWFDMNKCRRGVECLVNYQRKLDAKNKVYMNQPLHNWASHGADAFRTLALGIKELSEGDFQNQRLPRQAEGDFSIF